MAGARRLTRSLCASPPFCRRGHGGPHDAGHYNSRASETGFFKSNGGSWDSDYGRFFLDWYSGALVAHADLVMGAAREVLAQRCRPRTIKEAREVREEGGGEGRGRAS